MSKQAALILPGPDWIQLTNVKRKIDKHKDMLLLTKTTIAGKTLDGVEKVVVIGHGGTKPNDFLVGSSPAELVELLGKTNFKKGKLRLDTCYSAYDSKDAAAPAVAAELKKKGLTSIVVSGTVGPSITGWDAKRGVVSNNEFTVACMLQSALEAVYETEINQAKEVAKKWKETLSSEDIAKLATEVSGHTKAFFDDFNKVLTSGPFKVVLQTANYKEYFDPSL